MAETLLIAVVLLAGFAVVMVMDAHGKARAYQHGRSDHTAERPPEAVTNVDLPAPNFNQREPETRRRETR